MGRNFSLRITLTPKQREVDANPARFKVLKVGRRGAKSWYIAKFLATNALTAPPTPQPGKHWYVSRTLDLGREEIFPILLQILPPEVITKVDERSLKIFIKSGKTRSVIAIKSTEKENNLRGRGLASVALDEAAFVPESIWDKILRPQLSGSRGPAIIASSPKKGWFTRLFNDTIRNPTREWAAFHWTIYENPHMVDVRDAECEGGAACVSCKEPIGGSHQRECPLSELSIIKAKTPVNTWLQEYMAEEVSEDGQVYDEFSKANIFDPTVQFLDAKKLTTIRGLDWGTAAEAACVWLGIDGDGRLIISSEHVQNGWDPERQAEAIHNKSITYPPITLNILDRSAFRKESSLTSVADQFRLNRIPCQMSERDVQGSLGMVKRFLRGGSEPWLFISAKCPKLIEAFQNWEHGDHEPDVAAAARYAVTWAVTKRMTKLADHLPMVSHAATKPYNEKEAALIFAQQARVVPVSRKKQWTLTEYGVPG